MSALDVPAPPVSPAKSDAGNAKSTTDQTEGVGIARFIELAKTLALEKFNEPKENRIIEGTKHCQILVEDPISKTARFENWTCEKSIKDTSFDLSKEENAENLHVTISWEGRTRNFQSPFLKDELDYHFDNLTRSVDDLQEFLTKKVVLPTSLDQTLVQPDLAFVDTDPQDPSQFFNMSSLQGDKGYAIVVAGESGSGKSVFSCLQAQKCGYIPLYCCINMKADYFKRNPKPRGLRFANLNLFFQSVIDKNEKDEQNEKDERVVARLYALKNKLNRTRNQWAQQILDEAVRDVVQADDTARSWLDNKWRKDCLPAKVAIIVDEATDIDLAEGLVAKVRDIQHKYSFLAQEPILLVIAGVGLDAVKDRKNVYSRRVGTNPDYSRLIIMKSPNL